jgi:hypothetical protein
MGEAATLREAGAITSPHAKANAATCFTFLVIMGGSVSEVPAF